MPTTAMNAEGDEPLRRHTERDPEETDAKTIEDSPAYERAVEDDSVQPPTEQQDPGAGDLAPDFQEPN